MKTKTQLEKGCTKLLDGGRLIRCGDTYEGELELCEECKATLTQTNAIIEIVVQSDKEIKNLEVFCEKDGVGGSECGYDYKEVDRILKKLLTKIKGDGK